MSEYTDNDWREYLAHSWGKKPEQKKREKTYNHKYWLEHRKELLAKMKARYDKAHGKNSSDDGADKLKKLLSSAGIKTDGKNMSDLIKKYGLSSSKSFTEWAAKLKKAFPNLNLNGKAATDAYQSVMRSIPTGETSNTPRAREKRVTEGTANVYKRSANENIGRAGTGSGTPNSSKKKAQYIAPEHRLEDAFVDTNTESAVNKLISNYNRGAAGGRAYNYTKDDPTSLGGTRSARDSFEAFKAQVAEEGGKFTSEAQAEREWELFKKSVRPMANISKSSAGAGSGTTSSSKKEEEKKTEEKEETTESKKTSSGGGSGSSGGSSGGSSKSSKSSDEEKDKEESKSSSSKSSGGSSKKSSSGSKSAKSSSKSTDSESSDSDSNELDANSSNTKSASSSNKKVGMIGGKSTQVETKENALDSIIDDLDDPSSKLRSADTHIFDKESGNSPYYDVEKFGEYMYEKGYDFTSEKERETAWKQFKKKVDKWADAQDEELQKKYEEKPEDWYESKENVTKTSEEDALKDLYKRFEKMDTEDLNDRHQNGAYGSFLEFLQNMSELAYFYKDEATAKKAWRKFRQTVRPSTTSEKESSDTEDKEEKKTKSTSASKGLKYKTAT